MKLYQYDELRKLNQALGSFKRNKVPVENVEVLTVGDKVIFFVLADPVYEERPPRPKKEKVEKKAEKKEEKKEEKKKEENKEKKS